MESLFNNPFLSDVIIILEDPITKLSLNLHKAILFQNSQYFQKLFLSKYKESKQHEIILHVPDVTEATTLLKWFYEREKFIPNGTQELAGMWLVPGFEKIETISYPGPRGDFVLTEDLSDSLGYVSLNQNSMITLFSVWSNHDKIRLYLKFRNDEITISESIDQSKEKSKILNSYLEQYHIKIPTLDYIYGHVVNTPENVKSILKILLENNNFKLQDRERLEKISLEI